MAIHGSLSKCHSTPALNFDPIFSEFEKNLEILLDLKCTLSGMLLSKLVNGEKYVKNSQRNSGDRLYSNQ